MPTGPCPANIDGEQWWPVDASRPELGGVKIFYHGTWDGTSTRTGANGCIGPLVSLGGKNSAAVTMYAHFRGRKGTPRTISIAAGFDNIANPYTQPQLSNQGLSDTGDVEGIVVNASPANPA